MIIIADKKTKFLILLVAVNMLFSTSFSDIADNAGTNKEKAKNELVRFERKAYYNLVKDRIIDSAMKYIGVPPRMGGTSYRGMDCSGLVVTAFRENGINLPHSCKALSCYGTVINERHNLIKGDLIFFTGTCKSDYYVTHTGLYIGDGKFIHTSSRKGVTVTNLDNPWWQRKFAFGARILKEQS